MREAGSISIQSRMFESLRLKKKRKGKERKVDVRVSADDNVGGRGGSGSHGNINIIIQISHIREGLAEESDCPN